MFCLVPFLSKKHCFDEELFRLFSLRVWNRDDESVRLRCVWLRNLAGSENSEPVFRKMGLTFGYGVLWNETASAIGLIALSSFAECRARDSATGTFSAMSFVDINRSFTFSQIFSFHKRKSLSFYFFTDLAVKFADGYISHYFPKLNSD